MPIEVQELRRRKPTEGEMAANKDKRTMMSSSKKQQTSGSARRRISHSGEQGLHLVAPYCAIPRDYLSDTPLLLRKAPDTFNFLRHVMRAILSVRPKCSHRCVSLKETALKPVQILKHTTKNSAEETSMRTKWFKHIAI